MVNTIFQGILLGLSIAAPIGPINIEIIRRGLKQGWKSAASFYLGVLVALIIYLLLAVFGLAALAQSKIFNISILFFGVLVLFYLSYNSFKDFFAQKELDSFGKVDSKKNFIPGIILTISNPAVLLFWTGIMGASLASSSNSLLNGLILSFGILVGVIIFAFIIIPITHGGRRFITQKNFKYVSLASGLILLYFAIKFGYKFITIAFNI